MMISPDFINGYKLLLCHNVFIHHFGSISFGTDNRKFDDLLRANKLKFLKNGKLVKLSWVYVAKI